MCSTRTFVSHGQGTLCTPSFSGISSSVDVESAITGISAFCGVLLPIAPTKASRTPLSTLGVRIKRCAPSSSSSTTPVGWESSRTVL
jgi:hypothetical protein